MQGSLSKLLGMVLGMITFVVWAQQLSLQLRENEYRSGSFTVSCQQWLLPVSCRALCFFPDPFWQLPVPVDGCALAGQLLLRVDDSARSARKLVTMNTKKMVLLQISALVNNILAPSSIASDLTHSFTLAKRLCCHFISVTYTLQNLVAYSFQKQLRISRREQI